MPLCLKRRSSSVARRALPCTALDVGLAEHREALSACRGCGLKDSSAVPIISLAVNPRVMLVGQAPGKTETIDRRPFAGRAGRTLFKWLEEAGVPEAEARERIYIAAITRCYPGPGPSGRGDRVPSPREQALCSGWLDSELQLIRPQLLIPVGRLAINRFVGAAPLDRVIGREHTVKYGMGGTTGSTTAIPLPHPSGASSWVHEAGHRELLNQALDLLRVRLGETLYF